MNASTAAAARRILHRYRKLVLLGRARLPLAAARSLVGPDCAYHLYCRSGGARAGTSAACARGGARRRRRPRDTD